MKKVLVTGARGLIGRHSFPALLSRDYEVHALSKSVVGERHAGVTWHAADLMDASRVAALMAEVRPTHLLHFAWVTAHGKYWTSEENLPWVRASLELLQQFARGGGERVVMAGTCAEYDWRYGYCSEHLTPLAPATLYGRCKHALQLMLDGFARQFSTSAAWGRIFFLYGPQEHEDRIVAHVIRSLLRGERARCSHGNQIRDFLYTVDAAEAFVALLESDVRGAVNIASGQPVTLKELIYKIADRLDGRDLIDLGAIAAARDEPPLLVADVTRLKKEVGWSPRFNLDEGLGHSIDWWKSRAEGGGKE
jgi:nucleoside-diphosphate-sugar epimerase